MGLQSDFDLEEARKQLGRKIDAIERVAALRLYGSGAGTSGRARGHRATSDNQRERPVNSSRPYFPVTASFITVSPAQKFGRFSAGLDRASESKLLGSRRAQAWGGIRVMGAWIDANGLSVGACSRKRNCA